MANSGRDWLSKDQRERFNRGDHFRKASEPRNWLRIIFTWVCVLYLLIKASKYFLGSSFKGPTAPLPVEPFPTAVVEVVPDVTARPEVMSRPPVSVQQAQQLPSSMNSSGTQPGVTTIDRCKAFLCWWNLLELCLLWHTAGIGGSNCNCSREFAF
jgi:hypothetical protein